jgi:hypothetical protein
MIIWLASYPKSGNTWVRGFIISLLYTAEGTSNLEDFKKINQYPLKSHFENLTTDFNDITKFKKYYHKSQDIINLDNKIRILKTHNALLNVDGDNFSSTKNTLGVIHIVRDPRNVVTSLKHHYSIPDYKKAKEFLFDERRIIIGNFDKKDYPLPTLLASWKTHYLSWKQVKLNYLLIKYENLLNNPIQEFKKISNYLSKLLTVKISEKKIENSIRSNSFNNLKKMEELNGFGEFIAHDNKKFFNLGPKNNWETLLERKTADEIEDKFKNEMKELGYI